ncbi:MAG: type I-E CRISPR-associated protein Cse2/CasB [Deltaproteobacteria bacterium]|nr:type I-E CRISPR-associated protein Cse2/CasB [Deltaproteobacteria bacterium]MBN2845167.1 type I-E CRISPR-associated protein Cse2/CasB [Deltaproteobacteria bacterium]
MNEGKYLRFSKDSPESKALLEWWRGLENNRGDRAALRRCRSLTEVVFVPSYHRLRQELLHFGNVDSEGLAITVALAAQVKADNSEHTLAQQMALPKAGGSAKVSGLRFRRLLKIQRREDMYHAMIRIMALLGSSLNLISLAESVYWWNDLTRKKWAFEYYTNAPSEK